MKLSLYVHDLFYEIGHSNVTLNSLEYIKDIESYDIRFIVFTSDKKNNLFKKNIPVEIKYVPFSNIRPVLIKIIWFQIYTFFYSLLNDRDRVSISLGVANLKCDISIIHFIHKQWSSKYFKILNPKGITKFYKCILYAYLNFCENILFNLSRPKVITVSKFMNEYIRNSYNYTSEEVKTIHSGFDLNRFTDVETNLAQLQTIHPTLKEIDYNKPLCLFVGAYERKGLKELIELWKKKSPEANLLIIGKSEGQSRIDTSSENIFLIEHTSEMNRIYQISDSLLFPTHYEPFGMVIIEALIKGLDVYTIEENVGASEILTEVDGVNIYKSINTFDLPNQFKKISKKLRSERIEQRREYFKKYNWNEISKSYSQILKQWEENL